MSFQVRELGGKPLKLWIDGVPIEEEAVQQLGRVSRLPFIYKWVAAMPDCHFGMGATVGSVIATQGAVIPAAIGVDVGCGMRAVRTQLRGKDIDPKQLRAKIERRVPVGFDFHKNIHRDVKDSWPAIEVGYNHILNKMPGIKHDHVAAQIGTLGGGNHFIEVSLDETDHVWVVIHSGSRGVGNKIGVDYIRLAKDLCKRWHVSLEDPNLSFFPQDAQEYTDYMYAVNWAQNYALKNREIMMQFVMEILDTPAEETIDCHHNYVTMEHHYGTNVLLTRKGAVSAKAGEMGIIPGSMGARSYIVRGLGNPESFNSCSHGAGRMMSRSQAKKTFTTEDHAKATAGIECRKDTGILDETPGAYKDIDAVMAAQNDLCEPVHTLRQTLCVKG